MNKQQFISREALRAVTRRHFFRQCGVGLGSVALCSLLNESFAAKPPALDSRLSTFQNPLAPKAPQFPAKAKRVIYLHMAGSPSQLDLFDYKPKLIEMNGQP